MTFAGKKYPIAIPAKVSQSRQRCHAVQSLQEFISHISQKLDITVCIYQVNHWHSVCKI